MGRIGPLGIAFMGYRLWRRLSPRQKAAIRHRISTLVPRAKQGAAGSEKAAAPSTMSRVGTATAPNEEIPLSGTAGGARGEAEASSS
jgi:hypothetical protein